MRSIKFSLSQDEAGEVAALTSFADFKDLTPKQLFMRLIRNRLESMRAAEVAAQPKPKGRPSVIINGLERKEWVAARVAAYSAAEKMAAHDDPNYEWREESLKQAMAERCWEFAEAGQAVPLYLKTIDGKLYDIAFPPIEGEE